MEIYIIRSQNKHESSLKCGLLVNLQTGNFNKIIIIISDDVMQTYLLINTFSFHSAIAFHCCT